VASISGFELEIRIWDIDITDWDLPMWSLARDNETLNRDPSQLILEWASLLNDIRRSAQPDLVGSAVHLKVGKEDWIL